MEQKSISLDEAVWPEWFQKKTRGFPFLSCAFTIGLIVFLGYFLNSISLTAYQRGLEDGQKVKKEAK